MWFDFLKDIDTTYEERKLDRTEVNNFIVSTAYTADEGFETAIIDKNGTHPVERYSNEVLAKSGHKKWSKFCLSNRKKKIKKLGWTEFSDWMDKELILEN